MTNGHRPFESQWLVDGLLVSVPAPTMATAATASTATMRGSATMTSPAASAMGGRVAAAPPLAPAVAEEELKPEVRDSVIRRSIEIAGRHAAIVRVVVISGRTLDHVLGAGGRGCAEPGNDAAGQ
jgi:hypothetical protein